MEDLLKVILLLTILVLLKHWEQETIDFALIPPFAYILANKKNGSEALLTSIGKNDEPGYYSVLLVRTDSGIEKVEDLKGKKSCLC